MTPAEARANLAAALDGLTIGEPEQPVTVHPRQPSRVTPPCVILTPADPWMDTTEDLPYGAAWFRYTAQVIVPNGTLEAVSDDLDSLVGSVILAALSAPGEWHMDSVSAPDPTLINDQPYLSADVALSAPFTL
ncbi:hypothetical protein [Promicromonospora sp. NPDC050262]|uniref:hypothetical protein n=1 Tax=Promicromonospora sp. NPDC050262 TaxID=3155036 RepID=UPI0033D76945